jgi:hypothetical protein
MKKTRGGDRLALALAGALVVTGAVVPAALAQPAGFAMPAFQKPEAWPTTPAPAAAAKFEGVWKLAKPTTTLKPVSGEVPFTADGKARYDENKKLKAQGKIDDYDITKSRCSTPGVPRLMLTPMRFKIWIRLNAATFDFEWNRALRQIDMRGWKKEPPLVPDMAGQAVGHWEGDTLVSVTTDVSERTLLDDLVPHTDAMKVTERFRLIDADTLEDRITIEDPAYFTRPWEAVLTYKRQPDALFPEDICLDRLDANKPALPSS